MVRDLRQAQKDKKDEFYTQYEDIEKELINYKNYFKDKIVYCNCDDPETSNFTKYFLNNFSFYELKKLVCTHFEYDKPAYKLEYTGKESPKITSLSQNFEQKNVDLFEENEHFWSGDFRSQECIEILKEADIVVTNPPFSLFKEFINQLSEYNKDFIIIGNTNSISYKETFKLIKENRLWIGNTNFNTGMYFNVPDSYEKYKCLDSKGNKLARVSTSCWFTNIDYPALHKMIPLLSKQQNERNGVSYKKYENFDGIEVSTYKNIPFDYDGIMGVPITFMGHYNPDQFEIIGLGIANLGLECGVQPYKEEHKKYRKEVQKRGAVDGDLYMLDDDGHPKVPYARILIKHKKRYDEFGFVLEDEK